MVKQRSSGGGDIRRGRCTLWRPSPANHPDFPGNGVLGPLSFVSLPCFYRYVSVGVPLGITIIPDDWSGRGPGPRDASLLVATNEINGEIRPFRPRINTFRVRRS
jgi:hypothetical protein